MIHTSTGVLAYIPPPPTNGFQLGPLFVHIYGIAIATGVVLAFWLAMRRWRAIGRDPAELDPILIWSIVAGFIGGRIGYIIPRVGTFDPWWEVFAIWQGGLALYGGLTLGVATGLVLTWRRGVPPLVALDVVIPAIPLAQAVGRWGNYFNQELFGTPSTLPWALEVEAPFRPDAYTEFATFHPAFLYESLYNLLVVAVLLWIGRSGRLRLGSLALCYGVMYGIGRFALEQIRTDTTFRLFGLSRNAWVSLVVVIGCALLLWWRERSRPSPDSGGPSDEREDPPAEPAGGLGGVSVTAEPTRPAESEAEAADRDAEDRDAQPAASTVNGSSAAGDPAAADPGEPGTRGRGGDSA